MAEAALRATAPPAAVARDARRSGQASAIQAHGGGESAGLDPDAAVRAAGRGGAPLDGPVRAYFEPRFGHDFGQVRVHADAEAADGARAVRARAYTIGEQIVFGA